MSDETDSRIVELARKIAGQDLAQEGIALARKIVAETNNRKT